MGQPEDYNIDHENNNNTTDEHTNNTTDEHTNNTIKRLFRDKENTFVKVTSSMGEVGIAGTILATNKIPIEKKEANIPATTT